MRYISLDMTRGFAIATMLFVNVLTFLSSDLPSILQHNQPTMLPGDLIAPLFQFILGVSLTISVSRRKARGEQVWKHVLKRGITLILLGFVLVSVLYGFQETRWGVLQSLGVGILIGYVFLLLRPVFRVIAALGILLGYGVSFAFLPWFSESVLTSIHGGLLGAISYGTVTIFGTVAGDLFYGKRTRPKRGVQISAGLVFLSILLNFIIPFNKPSISASYSLFSAGFSFLLLTMFYFLGEQKKIELSVLSMLGRNSLSLWIAQYVLFYAPLIYLAGGCCFFPFYLGVAGTALVLPLFYVLADVLDWKGIRIPI